MYENNNAYSNNAYTGSGYQNGGYQEPQYEAPDGNGPEEPKKDHTFLKKLGVSAACALVFGLVAGGTISGMNARSAAPKQAEKKIEETVGEVIEETEGEEIAEAETEAVKENEETKAETAEASPAQEELSLAKILDVSPIVEKAMPSVVAIDVKGEQTVSSFFGYSRTYETQGAGSGILIGENEDEYLIVTNNHVIENTKSMSVQFIDGESAPAELKGTDPGKDVAVIAVAKKDVADATKAEIRIAEVGDSDNLKVGQGVVAIGNALGYGQSVTVGYISAKGRSVTAQDGSGSNTTVEDLLQTDAAINPGNSGGALLDMEGRVIGINESKSVSTMVEGMGYAIPISNVTDLIENLSARKTRAVVAENERGFIGFQGSNVDTGAAEKFNMPVGIFVYRILEGGAAEDSELREEDIITQLDGQTVTTIEELKDKLTRYAAGEEVILTVQRRGAEGYEEKKISVILGGETGSIPEEKAEKEKAEKKAEPEDEKEAEEPEDGMSAEDILEELFRQSGFPFRW